METTNCSFTGGMLGLDDVNDDDNNILIIKVTMVTARLSSNTIAELIIQCFIFYI